MATAKSVAKVNTDQDKAFVVMKQDYGVLYKIGLEGGGVVPEDLKGQYTSIHAAQLDIQKYLAKRG